jgi:spore coat protein U-like protein
MSVSVTPSRTRRSAMILALAASVLAPSAVVAQTPLTVSVTVSTALSVSVAQALLFGTLTPGGNRTIAASDEVNAGRYQVTGTGGSSVNLAVTFPDCLRVSAGTCTATDPALDTFTADWASALASTHTALTGTGSSRSGIGTIGGAGNLFVFVGAKVTIPAATTPGSYNGTVTLTANY